jgi:hypothetical protein
LNPWGIGNRSSRAFRGGGVERAARRPRASVAASAGAGCDVAPASASGRIGASRSNSHGSISHAPVTGILCAGVARMPFYVRGRGSPGNTPPLGPQARRNTTGAISGPACGPVLRSPENAPSSAPPPARRRVVVHDMVLRTVQKITEREPSGTPAQPGWEIRPRRRNRAVVSQKSSHDRG